MRPLWLACLFWAAPAFAEVKITYLANEGVLLTSGSTKIVVDALFRDSLGDYQRHSLETQEQLETGKGPFAGIALALATHYHLDHWDAGAISRFLSSNPSALFASTPQATGMLPRSQRPRVRSIWNDGAMQLTHAGVTIEASPLQHGETQNLAYRIAIGGKTLIHVGDAEASADNFKVLLAKESPDVALVPFWWLLTEAGRTFIRDTWKPRQVVAFHFGKEDLAVSASKVRDSIPGLWLCERPGESRVY